MAETIITLPTIPQPFANDGQYALFPAQATGTNRASFEEGWSDITSTPIADGGVPPNRLDFNGLGWLATATLFAMQQGKFWTYSADVANAIGGYPAGAVLWVVENGRPTHLVVSLINNNTNSNLSDSSAWKKLTLNMNGDKMLGTLADQSEAQVRNIEIVETEPETGVDGTIYAIIEA